MVLAGISTGPDSESGEAIDAGRLRIVRLHRPPYDRTRFLDRAIWTLATNLALVWRLRRELRHADEILFTGSPPFLIQLLVPLNAVLRRRLTYRITDFYPECLIAARRRTPLPLRTLLRLTLALRRRVHRIEVLGEDQRARLVAAGIPEARIVLRRDPSPVAIAPDTRPLDLPAELRGKAVLLYSGNFGVAHDHATLVDGYRAHHRGGSGRVVLWLNATGAGADLVERALRAEGLPLHRTRLVPLAELPRLLVTPAAHLITLRDEFVGYVLPSKVHGCVASGRPVLYIGSPRSDVHLLCAAGLPPERYVRVDVGDAEGVARALEAVAAWGIPASRTAR